MSRSAQLVSFALLSLFGLVLLTVVDQRSPEQKAEQLAREQMRLVIGADAINRAHVEVRPSAVGWMVVFRNANASCADGVWWPGACRFAANSFRDVYACVERDWRIRQMGATSASEPLGTVDLCRAPPSGLTATLAPTSAPSP